MELICEKNNKQKTPQYYSEAQTEWLNEWMNDVHAVADIYMASRMKFWELVMQINMIL